MKSAKLKSLWADRKKLLLNSCLALYWHERDYHTKLESTRIELPPKRKFPWWEDLDESQLENIEKSVTDRFNLLKEHEAETKHRIQGIIYHLISIDYQIAIEKQRIKVCPRVRIPNYIIFSLVAIHIHRIATTVLKYKTWLEYYQGVITKLVYYHLHPETHSARQSRFFKLVVPSVTRVDNPLYTAICVDSDTAKYFKNLLTKHFTNPIKRKKFIKDLIKREFLTRVKHP